MHSHLFFLPSCLRGGGVLWPWHLCSDSNSSHLSWGHCFIALSLSWSEVLLFEHGSVCKTHAMRFPTSCRAAWLMAQSRTLRPHSFSLTHAMSGATHCLQRKYAFLSLSSSAIDYLVLTCLFSCTSFSSCVPLTYFSQVTLSSALPEMPGICLLSSFAPCLKASLFVKVPVLMPSPLWNFLTVSSKITSHIFESAPHFLCTSLVHHTLPCFETVSSFLSDILSYLRTETVLFLNTWHFAFYKSCSIYEIIK